MTIDRMVEHARLALDENDHQRALTIIKAAVSRAPLNRSVLSLAGRFFRLRTQFDRADRFLSIAAISAPDSWSSWADLGELRRAQGDLDTAINCRWRAFRAHPLGAETVQALAAALLEANRPVNASRMYKRALLANPNSVASRIGFATALLAGGAARELTMEAARLAKTMTRFAGPERNLVNQLLRKRQFDAAELVLEPVLRALPNNLGAWRAMALAREFADDDEAGLRAIRRALLINPSDFVSHQIHARFLLNNHPRTDPSISLRRLLRLAVTKASDEANILSTWLSLGAFAIRIEEFGQASRAYGNALMIAPAAPAASMERAYTLLAAGDTTNAERTFLRARIMDQGESRPETVRLSTLNLESVGAYCRRVGQPFRIVAPAFLVDRKPETRGSNHFGPKAAFDLRVDGWLRSSESLMSNRYPVPETFIGRVDGAMVVPRQFSVLTIDNSALFDGLIHNTPARLNFGPCFRVVAPNNIILAEIPRESDHHDIEAVLIGGGRNYYHCLLDWFSKLSVVAADPNLGEMPLVVSGNMPTAAWEFLELLGIPKNRLIKMTDRPARFHRLWLPSLAHGRFGFTSPRYIEFLEERILSKIRNRDRPGHRRLYISRRGGTTRRVLNETELIIALESLDFEVVHAETLSAREQLCLFGEAEIVIGVIGAGLTNILAAPINTAVVELTHSHSLRVNIEVLAGLLGHRFTRLLGHRQTQGNTTPAHSDFVVPVAKLVETVITQLGKG